MRALRSFWTILALSAALARAEGAPCYIKTVSASPNDPSAYCVLRRDLDLEKLERGVRRVRGYKTTHREQGLRIARRFKGAEYHLDFDAEALRKSPTGKPRIVFQAEALYRKPACSLPAAEVLSRTHEVIDGLPLTAEERAELKSHVAVESVADGVDDRWGVCEKSADCVEINGVCSAPACVNKTSAEAAHRFFAHLTARADCPIASAERPKVSPACVDRRCGCSKSP